MLTAPWQTNNLDQFAKIMHIDDGRNMYWPGPFNLSYDVQAYNHRHEYYYNDFQPYQSPNHFYQPANTGGMVNMNAMASSYSDNFPQYQSPYHLGHLGQPEDMGEMVNMNFMASLDSDRLQPYQLPCLQPYQSPDHLGYFDQPEDMGFMDMGFMDNMNAMNISDSHDVQGYQSSYHLDHLPPYQSPYDPVNLGQPGNMGWMDNMNAMASSDGAGNPDSINWAEEMDSMDPYHAERLTS